jgi:hypothetical protein
MKILILACVFLAACSQSPEQAATRDAIMSASSEAGTLFVIHKPKEGCPDGWTPITSAFLEADGSSIDACIHGTGAQGGAIDYVSPGEAFPGILAIWSLGAPKDRT